MGKITQLAKLVAHGIRFSTKTSHSELHVGKALVELVKTCHHHDATKQRNMIDKVLKRIRDARLLYTDDEEERFELMYDELIESKQATPRKE